VVPTEVKTPHPVAKNATTVGQPLPVFGPDISTIVSCN
jgi:hypothetical protein